MRREDLEHVLHAAADVTEEVEFVVIGSQAVLGEVPDAPAELVERIPTLPVTDAQKQVITARLGALRR